VGVRLIVGFPTPSNVETPTSYVPTLVYSDTPTCVAPDTDTAALDPLDTPYHIAILRYPTLPVANVHDETPPPDGVFCVPTTSTMRVLPFPGDAPSDAELLLDICAWINAIAPTAGVVDGVIV